MVRVLQSPAPMRKLLAILVLVVTAAVAGAYPYTVRQAPAVPPPTTNDLQRAQRLADKARARLERPRRATSGWAYGPATR